MKPLQILQSLKYRFFGVLILILLISYIILRYFFFESDPLIQFLSSLADNYLIVIEKFSNQILIWIGSEVTVEKHRVLMNGVPLVGFDPKIYFKVTMILFLSLIWITRTTFRRKALFTFLLIVVHFLVVSVYITTGAQLTGSGNNDYTLLSIPVTLGMLCIFTITFIWYRKHKDMILNKLSKLNLNIKLFQNDFHVITVAFIYIVTYYFLYDIFEYGRWIDFLFTVAQKILALFGYAATVEPFYLVGENGSIFMLKSCLGFQTMLLFAIIIFLTGSSNNRIRWTYIISGLMFLNFANIMRFVFLFIHIQKHGDYMLAMDLHDMYNYIIYTLVFILWVIWFEKIADYHPKKHIKGGIE